MEKLHPGARWSFRMGIYPVFLILLFFVGTLLSSFSRLFNLSYVYLFLVLIFGVIFAFVFGEVYARLAYNNWKYEFTKSELRIENGIIFKNYKSIPYQRIQNVDIHRGLLARILGFSAVNIQTAGYSGFVYRGRFGSHSVAEGYLPAVSIKDAEKIREFVIKNIGNKKSGI